MYQKTIFTLLLFLAPIAFIEQNKNSNSSQINSNKYFEISNDNYHLIDRLFEANEENSIEIKIVGKKEISYLRKDIAHLTKHIFITLKIWI